MLLSWSANSSVLTQVASDGTLGIVNVPIANLASGAFMVLDSGDIAALFVANRCTSSGTCGNTASTSGESAETGATVTDSDPAVLVWEADDTCLTHTPGFWDAHPHVTGQYLDIEVCGKIIDNTEAGNVSSSAEAMCMSGVDAIKATPPTNMHYLQLVRQLTAAKLNIAASATDGGTCDSVGGVNIDALIVRCEVAALCAQDQGKHWEMHDLLFATPRDVALETLKAHAAKLDLEASRFAACLDDEKDKDRLAADMALGGELGVSGMPAFFLGVTEPGSPGKARLTARIPGAVAYPVFSGAIDAMLAPTDAKP